MNISIRYPTYIHTYTHTHTYTHIHTHTHTHTHTYIIYICIFIHSQHLIFTPSPNSFVFGPLSARRKLVSCCPRPGLRCTKIGNWQRWVPADFSHPVIPRKMSPKNHHSNIRKTIGKWWCNHYKWWFDCIHMSRFNHPNQYIKTHLH